MGSLFCVGIAAPYAYTAPSGGLCLAASVHGQQSQLTSPPGGILDIAI